MSKDAYKDVRTKIVQAAQERMWHFGYKKTTIDEIAADAGIGKGTIYIHFDSKEEIALEIMAHFKKQSLAEVRSLASCHERPVVTRIKDMLLQPILMSHARCSQSPAALEMVTSIGPNIHSYLKPFLWEELEVLAQVLEEGNSAGLFAIDDCKKTAQTLKHMCAGFWPPFPCISGEMETREAISNIVDLAFHGLQRK